MSARQIVDEMVVVEDHPAYGRKAMLVLPVVPEAAPYRVREGIARRRVAALTGSCPCGALTVYRDLDATPHESDCPAVTWVLLRAIRRWVR